MSALAIECDEDLRLFDEENEPQSLDELISRSWRNLAGHRTAVCPVCGGELAPTYGQHAFPTGGRCRHCDSELR